MSKIKLVKALAYKAELTNKEAAKVLDAFIEVVTETLAKEEDVALPGFGSFSVAERKARTARDFRTGKDINVPATRLQNSKLGSY